jgi:hypothetical protein
MCSGCSDNFEHDGDWEQDDCSMADCDPEEFWTYLREHGRLWGVDSDRAQEAPLVLGEYEIVVTADRIVERRIVRAKSFIVGENRPASGTYPVKKSAKTYQTLGAFQDISSYGGFDIRKWLPWRHLAVLAAVGMALLVAAW